MRLTRLVSMLALFASVELHAQTAQPIAAARIDALLRTQGPDWVTRTSPHFILHVERPAPVALVALLLDSLESGWAHAVSLLKKPRIDETQTHVLVTRSRTRFGTFLSPEARGVTAQIAPQTHVILMVNNDSVRAYTRHEAMHLVTRRAWGAGSLPAPWLVEGLGVLADGRCQSASMIAVARDVLHAQPLLTAAELMQHFVDRMRRDRAGTYVLAGSFVDFLWSTRGLDGVRELWNGAPVVDDSPLPGAAGALTGAWRAYVDRKAGQAPGLPVAAFRRYGCG